MTTGAERASAGYKLKAIATMIGGTVFAIL